MLAVKLFALGCAKIIACFIWVTLKIKGNFDGIRWGDIVLDQWRSPVVRYFRGAGRRCFVTNFEIARKHFNAALAEAAENGFGADVTARYFLNLVVTKYLETRTVDDVRSELAFVAENCDPETDYMFMRP
jgi:hypothetical protein